MSFSLRLFSLRFLSLGLLSPARGRGRVRGLRTSTPPHLTSPPSGGEEHEGDMGRVIKKEAIDEAR